MSDNIHEVQRQEHYADGKHLGTLVFVSNGDVTAFDTDEKIVGKYIAADDKTVDEGGAILSEGYTLNTLIRL